MNRPDAHLWTRQTTARITCSTRSCSYPTTCLCPDGTAHTPISTYSSRACRKRWKSTADAKPTKSTTIVDASTIQSLRKWVGHSTNWIRIAQWTSIDELLSRNVPLLVRDQRTLRFKVRTFHQRIAHSISYKFIDVDPYVSRLTNNIDSNDDSTT